MPISTLRQQAQHHRPRHTDPQREHADVPGQYDLLATLDTTSEHHDQHQEEHIDE